MMLFPENDVDFPPQAARLAPKLSALAVQGIYFGTSSWKYEGWLGSIYREDRYLTARQAFQEEIRGSLLARVCPYVSHGLR